MIGCIVVDHADLAKEHKYEGVLQEIFLDDRFEVNESEDGMTIIFVYKIEKIKVWQAVMELEVKQIPVGFGFGDQKESAKKEAMERLNMIVAMKDHKKNLA